MWLHYAALILGTACTIAVILPVAQTRIWWVRIFDFPKLQLIGLLMLAIALYAYTTPTPWLWIDGALLTLFTISLLRLCYDIYPFTPLGRTQVPTQHNTSDTTLSLLVSNVRVLNGHIAELWNKVLDVDSDVVLLMETTQEWDAQKPDEIDERYPHQCTHPAGDGKGMMLFSKYPLKDDKVRFLDNQDVPSIDSYIEVNEQLPPIRFYGIHPEPPAPTFRDENRFEELYAIANELASSKEPSIVCGDLNEPCWSRITQTFLIRSQMRNPRQGRGLYCTFHAKLPFMRWPLDHIFLSSHFTLRTFERMKMPGSDHFALHTTLNVKQPDA